MEEWKTYKIGEVADVQTGPFGSQLHNNDYVESGTPIVTVEHLGQRQFSTQNLPMISDEDKIRLRKYVSKEGDIIFSRVGSVDRCSYVSANEEGWLFSGRCLRVRCNEGTDPLFVYYWFTLNSTKQEIRNIAVGATMPSINTKLLSELQISLPSLQRQKEISSILSSIDDKIELNNRINHNLEEQAQALYKSWFVDFEPFKDGKFVESELGIIPEGWHVGCYDDIISVTVSGDWGKEVESGNYTHKVSCIRGCDFSDVSSGVRGKTPERFILEKNFKNKRLLDKDIIVEISGGTPTVSTGRICLVSDNLLEKYSGDLVCTNFCRVIRPCLGFSSYVFYSWLDKYNSKVMFGYENGTSGIKNFHISDFLEKEPVLIPPQTVIAQFQTIVDVYQAAIQRNGNERMECEMVRDSVLPKLMSGELNINEIDC